MREIRLHGSEGGGAETNRSFLPLSGGRPAFSTGSHREREAGGLSRDEAGGLLVPEVA